MYHEDFRMAEKRQVSSYASWPRPEFAHTVKTNKNFNSNYRGALLYAHYELSSSELKKEVVKYIKSKDNKDPLLDRIKDMDENRFTTIGKYMYLLNHGADVPDDILPKLVPTLEKIVSEEEEKIKLAAAAESYKLSKKPSDSIDQQPAKVVYTIQDRLLEKTREVAGEIEGWIDEFHSDRKIQIKSVEDFVNLFKSLELKSPHMRYMKNIFEKRANEVAEALDTKDKDLAEAYSYLTKPELKKFDLFHRNLIKACDMLQEVAKVERAPRKKKPVSQEKIVSKLKFKKEDTGLGIVSLNPVHILGAKEVWVYNTKTRKLTQYKAADVAGLTVKGAGLLNFSADSVEKTVRKPAETLAEFKKASKVKLRTFMKDLSTLDVPANGKINEHHVILRIDK